MALRENKSVDWVFVILCGISIVFMLLPVSGPVQAVRALASYSLSPAPVQVHNVSRYLSSVPRNVVSLLEADQSARAFKGQLTEQSIKLARLEALEEENARLRGLLDLEVPQGWSGRWGRIVAREPADWNRSLVVDLGREHGVSETSVVLGVEGGEAGLLGRVIDVEARTAKVLLLTNELSHVTARIEVTGWEGLVSGTGKGRIKMRYLAQEAAVGVGESARVSPASTLFPPGIRIGKISRVLPKDPILTFQTVELEPAVRQERLQEVFLMNRSIGEGPASRAKGNPS